SSYAAPRLPAPPPPLPPPTSPPPTAPSPLSLHDALPICRVLSLFYLNRFYFRHRIHCMHLHPCHNFTNRHFFCRSKFFSHKTCLDRKSTRLNSSHVSISYAVFCLKKKNNNIPSRLYSH